MSSTKIFFYKGSATGFCMKFQYEAPEEPLYILVYQCPRKYSLLIGWKIILLILFNPNHNFFCSRTMTTIRPVPAHSGAPQPLYLSVKASSADQHAHVLHVLHNLHQSGGRKRISTLLKKTRHDVFSMKLSLCPAVRTNTNVRNAPNKQTLTMCKIYMSYKSSNLRIIQSGKLCQR